MGQDKGLLEYHGMPQRDYLARLLDSVVPEVFMSLRADQPYNGPVPVVMDRDAFRGPFNGLLSAHAMQPDVAWLVLACDMPLIDAEALRYLLKHRDTLADATAFTLEEGGLPEPMAAIWEPHALARVPEYLKEVESSCPRKFLIRSRTHLVVAQDPDILANANRPDEYQTIQSRLAR